MNPIDVGESPSVWDAVVVGLGPVGSTLAALLGKRGLRVLGIERELDFYPLPRAGHVDHTVLRTLREMNCLDEALGDMLANNGMNLLSGDGQVLAHLPVSPRTPSGLPASMHFHQPSLDRTLRNAAQAEPTVELLTSTEAVSFEQFDEEVHLEIRSGETIRIVRTGFVVGCDGASSKVRRLAGLELDDLGFAESWVVIDLILRERPVSLPRDTTFGADPARPYAAIELPGMRYRFEFMLLPREKPEDITHPIAVKQLIAPWLTPDQIEEIERAVVYTFRAATAKSWRNGRVLVAGDAAHLMPPFLGQGMCSGMRDAANLAWKIELVVRNGAPIELLDSYEDERGPHVKNVILTSMRLGQALCMLSPTDAAVRDREMLGSDLAPEQRLPFSLGELVPGTLVLEGGGMFMISPDVDGVTLDDVIGPRFLVLGRAPEFLDDSKKWWSEELGAVVTTLAQLGSAESSLRSWMDKRDVDVVVVRPDHYVLGGGTDLTSITNAVKSLLAASVVRFGG